MSNEAVFVTGSAGRVGSAVVAQLTRAGVGVVAVDRRGGEVGGVPVRKVDLNDETTVRTAMARCSAVIHLAAYPGPSAAPADEVFSNNVSTTFNVLAAAADTGISRVAIASSSSIYGLTFSPQFTSPLYVPIDEAHPIAAADPYSLSKHASEAAGQMFTRSHAMTVVALRLGWVATKDAIVERVQKVASNPSFGKSSRELWGYVELSDAARACVSALDVADGGFHAVNVLAPDSLSDEPTAELVRRIHPGTDIRSGIEGVNSAWNSSQAVGLLRLDPLWSWRYTESYQGDVSS